jgi:aryl-alcohol dehydrogenase-like predicted oxidoreductase
VEDGLLAECRRRDVALVAYSPLGKGLLAGRFSAADSFPEGDWRRIDPEFEREALAKRAEEFQSLERLARGEHCTLAQLGLAWLLSRGRDVLPIPGMRSVAQVEENVRAASIELSSRALALAEGCPA